MTATNIFGPAVSALDVAYAFRRTIQAWQADYLAEVAVAGGRPRGSLPLFRSFVLAPDEDRFVEDQLPSCLIVVPDIVSIHQGRGEYRATWDVRLGAVVSGQNRDNTLELTMLYTLALRMIALQKSSLKGHPDEGRPAFAVGLDWIGERYDLLDFDEGRRTLGGGAVLLNVTVDSVVASGVMAGPSTPSADPTIDPGPAATVDPQKITVSVRAEE